MKHLRFVNDRQIYCLIQCDDCEHARQVHRLMESGFVYWKRGIYVHASVFSAVQRRHWKPADLFFYSPTNTELAQQKAASVMHLPAWQIFRAAI